MDQLMMSRLQKDMWLRTAQMQKRARENQAAAPMPLESLPVLEDRYQSSTADSPGSVEGLLAALDSYRKRVAGTQNWENLPQAPVINMQANKTANVADNMAANRLMNLAPKLAANRVTNVEAKLDVKTVVKAAPTAPVQPLVADPKDWHIPELGEVFALAQKYPGKNIVLDCKLPESDPATAKRLATQIISLCQKYPDMKERIIVMCPDQGNLQAMKETFAAAPGFKDFKNFTLDDEKLNSFGQSDQQKSPLTGSEDNRYLSIGKAANPLKLTPMKDLEEEIRKTRRAIDDPSPDNPHRGKKLLVWTLNDQDEIRRAVQAGAHGILTDDPDAMNRTLDAMGFAKDDPKRPSVIAHRGGPNSPNYPENTLPAIEQGLRRADAIEIDVVSAKDGAAVFHDNSPTSLVGMIRNSGWEANNAYRPVYPSITDPAYYKSLNELTLEEIRQNYGFEKQLTGSGVANFAFAAATFLMRLPSSILKSITDHIKPLKFLSTAVDWVTEKARSLVGVAIAGADKLVTVVWRVATKVGTTVVNGVKKVGETLWSGAKSAVKSVGKFFKRLFG